MPRSVRIAPIGFAALLAAALGSATVALAFDKVDTLGPIAAGHGYVYYIDEVGADHQPLADRTVTMAVGNVPGGDAFVAPSDSGGHLTGAAGRTAVQHSGPDGLAYFVLRTSTTPGSNQFTWNDTAYTGEVLVATTAPSPAASPGVATGGVRGTRSGGPAATASGGHAPVPPLAAGIAAAAVVWIAGPSLLARRRPHDEEPPMPSLEERLPISG